MASFRTTSSAASSSSCSLSVLARFLAFFSLLALGRCTMFTINWTPEGVRNYTTSNPLRTELGDSFRFRCPDSGDFAHSTVWIQKHEEQYKNCDCAAGDGGGACDPGLYKNLYCSPPVSSGTITLILNDGELGSFFSFNPGQQYYLISYTNDESLEGVLSDVAQGGQCLEGLRMSFSIAEMPTEASTTEALNYTTESEDRTEVTTQIVTTDDSSSGENSGEGPKEYFTTPTTTDDKVGVEILASREVRDWHVGLIVVFGVAIFVMVVIFALSFFVVVRSRRKRDQYPVPVDQTEIKSPDEYKVRDDSQRDLDDVFVDPLDQA